jgi:hypothetical protein
MTPGTILPSRNTGASVSFMSRCAARRTHLQHANQGSVLERFALCCTCGRWRTWRRRACAAQGSAVRPAAVSPAPRERQSPAVRAEPRLRRPARKASPRGGASCNRGQSGGPTWRGGGRRRTRPSGTSAPGTARCARPPPGGPCASRPPSWRRPAITHELNPRNDCMRRGAHGTLH